MSVCGCDVLPPFCVFFFFFLGKEEYRENHEATN